jgi:hypothetical protein
VGAGPTQWRRWKQQQGQAAEQAQHAQQQVPCACCRSSVWGACLHVWHCIVCVFVSLVNLCLSPCLLVWTDAREHTCRTVFSSSSCVTKRPVCCVVGPQHSPNCVQPVQHSH